MTIQELVKRLDLTVYHLPDENRTVCGCYICDLLSWVIGRCQTGDVWLTVQTNANVLAVAVMAECACVLLVEGVQMETEVLQKARDQGVCVLGTSRTAYETACALNGILG